MSEYKLGLASMSVEYDNPAMTDIFHFPNTNYDPAVQPWMVAVINHDDGFSVRATSLVPRPFLVPAEEKPADKITVFAHGEIGVGHWYIPEAIQPQIVSAQRLGYAFSTDLWYRKRKIKQIFRRDVGESAVRITATGIMPLISMDTDNPEAQRLGLHRLVGGSGSLSRSLTMRGADGLRFTVALSKVDQRDLTAEIVIDKARAMAREEEAHILSQNEEG